MKIQAIAVKTAKKIKGILLPHLVYFGSRCALLPALSKSLPVYIIDKLENAVSKSITISCFDSDSVVS